MTSWQPATEQEVQAIIDQDLRECDPEQVATFSRFRVPLRRAPILRYGREESVFVVAQRDNEVMYWEDVEQGFNFSPVDEHGRIMQHWCNQDELKYALWNWMGQPQAVRLGPAGPVSDWDASQPSDGSGRGDTD